MKPGWFAARLTVEVLEDRTLLNNRFIVPLDVEADNASTFHTLQAALAPSGLAGGDIIQIEPGSSPGAITDANLDSALAATNGNLTIRGNPAFTVAEIPAFGVSNALTVSQPGFKLSKVQINLVGGNISFLSAAVNARITNSIITSYFTVPASDGVIELQSAGTFIRNSMITSSAGAIGSDVIQVTPVSGSANKITGNTISSSASGTQNLLGYNSAAVVVGDEIAYNSFLGNNGIADLLQIGTGLNNLTIQGNTFRDNENSDIAIDLLSTTKNIRVTGNIISLTGTSAVGIALAGGTSSATSATITMNQVSTANSGTGIRFDPGAGGPFTVKVQGNDLCRNAIGANILAGGGGSVTGLDLGGGSQGSLGANNFRSFTANATSNSAAIVISSSSAQGTVNAQKNLFKATNPETAIFDNNDDSGLGNVNAGNHLVGNAAFVQTLYLEFLKRAGSDSEIAAWTGKLATGMSAQSAANSFVRSTEALGIVVDGLYRRFLSRAADSSGRTGAVNFLQSGGTIEQLTTQIVSSAEYRTLFGSDAAFAQSLYVKLLNRIPSGQELSNATAHVQSQGRAAFASAVLGSAEYRRAVARRLFRDLLNRLNPSQGELDFWANTGMDELSIAVQFAGSSEFQSNA